MKRTVFGVLLLLLALSFQPRLDGGACTCWQDSKCVRGSCGTLGPIGQTCCEGVNGCPCGGVGGWGDKCDWEDVYCIFNQI
jgi:hypothetical protein